MAVRRQTLATGLTQLTTGGVCVGLGVSSGAAVTFDAAHFFRTGRTTLYGIMLFEAGGNEPASAGLACLAG